MTTEYKEYLTKWVEEVLSVPHELLNGLPVCPFARQAIIENKVEFFITSDKKGTKPRSCISASVLQI